IVLQGGPDTTIANGNDTVVAQNDTSMFLTNTALVRLIAGSATLLSIEKADLSVSPTASTSTTHTFTVSGWTNPEIAGQSPVTLSGLAGGIDQVSASADADFTLTDVKLERFNLGTIGTAPPLTSFKLSNITKALLAGGSSDNTF